MVHFLKWVGAYLVVGLISAIGGSLYEYGSIFGWTLWPIIQWVMVSTICSILFPFMLLGIPGTSEFFEIVFAGGGIVYLSSSVLYFLQRKDKWLVGVALGSSVISWPVITGVASIMSV